MEAQKEFNVAMLSCEFKVKLDTFIALAKKANNFLLADALEIVSLIADTPNVEGVKIDLENRGVFRCIQNVKIYTNKEF